MPPWGADDDSDEAEQAYERAWQPHHHADNLAASCDLPEREREAVQELLDPAAAIWLRHESGSFFAGISERRHRAHALMSAGVRWVPVIRSHCCRETEDCSPRCCYLLEGPLPAAHITSPPKSKRSWRTLPLFEPLTGALKALRDLEQIEAMNAGHGIRGQWLHRG